MDSGELLRWLWDNPGHVIAYHDVRDEIVVAHADEDGEWAMRTDGASRRMLIEDPWGDDSDLQRYTVVESLSTVPPWEVADAD